MADENIETELSWEEQQAVNQEIALRKLARISADENAKYAAEKKAQDLGSMTDEELRRYTRRLAGYDAI
jgi:hypothetical protein